MVCGTRAARPAEGCRPEVQELPVLRIDSDVARGACRAQVASSGRTRRIRVGWSAVACSLKLCVSDSLPVAVGGESTRAATPGWTCWGQQPLAPEPAGARRVTRTHYGEPGRAEPRRPRCGVFHGDAASLDNLTSTLLGELDERASVRIGKVPGGHPTRAAKHMCCSYVCWCQFEPRLSKAAKHERHGTHHPL
jgi:hypothetical protein